MRSLILSLSALLVASFGGFASADEPGQWVALFDGKNVGAWRASENGSSWQVEDGLLVCKGPRSHLFYMGDAGDEDNTFRNFEFKADVKTTPGSNAGIYFHTKYQETGWPKYGYECQVNVTHTDPKKTSSLYAVQNVMQTPAKDNEWYTQHIIVRGNKITLKVNGETQVEYEEPAGKGGFSKDFDRRLQPEGGTFALQAHDPKSVVYFKNIMVRRLP